MGIQLKRQVLYYWEGGYRKCWWKKMKKLFFDTFSKKNCWSPILLLILKKWKIIVYSVDFCWSRIQFRVNVQLLLALHCIVLWTGAAYQRYPMQKGDTRRWLKIGVHGWCGLIWAFCKYFRLIGELHYGCMSFSVFLAKPWFWK